VNKRLHDAIIHHFNFEYLYNFAFAPEKVTGLPYAPLRLSSQTSKAAVGEAVVRY
jgi:hypothetical protein